MCVKLTLQYCMTFILLDAFCVLKQIRDQGAKLGVDMLALRSRRELSFVKLDAQLNS